MYMIITNQLCSFKITTLAFSFLIHLLLLDMLSCYFMQLEIIIFYYKFWGESKLRNGGWVLW